MTDVEGMYLMGETRGQGWLLSIGQARSIQLLTNISLVPKAPVGILGITHAAEHLVAVLDPVAVMGWPAAPGIPLPGHRLVLLSAGDWGLWAEKAQRLVEGILPDLPIVRRDALQQALHRQLGTAKNAVSTP